MKPNHSKPTPWYRGKLLLLLVIVPLLALSIFFSPLGVSLFTVYIAHPVKFEGVSMKPTINDGDRLFISRRIKRLQRGDMILFRYPVNPDKSFIKRIVGLPGETVSIRAGQAYVNGRALSEPYVMPDNNRSSEDLPEQVIKAGHYFVVGDNRDHSNDSRFFGAVPQALIYGKVFVRYWPVGRR